VKEVVKQMLMPVRSLMRRAVMLPPMPDPENLADMTLIEKVSWLVASDKVEGDYLEFGVFRGNSFIRSYHTLKKVFEARIKAFGTNGTPEDSRERQAIWDRMRFFAFDSFKGLPELEGIDKETADFAEGQYEAGMEEVLANMAAHDVPLDRVTCVPGWFDQTCTPATIERYGIGKAAVVWVDCDLYHSTKSVLNFITPLLQDGTVIIFDDWYSYRGNPLRGEQRAFSEWRETLRGFLFSEYNKEGPWRSSFVVSEAFQDPLE